MNTVMRIDTIPQRPFRLWPGVAALALQWLVWFGIPIVAPDAQLLTMGVAVLCSLFIIVWWLFFSRAPWLDRVAPFLLMIAGVAVTKRLVDPSIAGGGMGMLIYLMAIPVMSIALVAWAVAGARLPSGPRRALMVGTVLLACGVFTVVRTAGVIGGSGFEFHWRWTPTPEERLLARGGDEPKPLAAAPAAVEIAAAPATVTPGGEAAPGTAATKNEPAARNAADAPVGAAVSERDFGRIEWPGFRGPGRDGVVRGERIASDWSQSPPVQLWRRPIGPGWSSFAVGGDLLYTQEQRGGDEIVSSYEVATGEPVWRHRDAVRFWESNGGAGPRATPTLSRGRVYTFGATGLVNALDAATGRVLWSRNAASDTHTKVPMWGFSSSPLVVGDLVIVATSGTLVAYDTASGHPRWVGPHHAGLYSSPQLATIDGVPQILLLNAPGATSSSPADGTLLWEHAWEGGAIVQPALTADGDVLISAMAATGGSGVRRLHVSRGSGGWTAEERWTSTGLKPYFNDYVVHKGHAFGFDGSILACIDLENGKRIWKGGRYGNGQLILLADQDVLLVLSEEGELALVGATADQFTEIARFPALEGKTWNHPVLAGDVLLVRNGQEMAAFRLAASGNK